MRILGLTGGVGSGKSVVDAIFRKLGAEVIDADVLAREVVEPGTATLKQIVDAFGPAVLLPDGRLNRAKLGATVFADAAARARLNAITHPPIHRRIVEEVEARRDQGGLLLVDVPLLYENGRQDLVEKVIVVWVDRATQLERLMKRDGLSEPEALQRIESQMPLDEKRRRADEVIDNTGTEENTRRQVEAIYRRYAS